MTMTHTTSGTVDLGNGSLYYEVAGAGETLVMSHAAFVDSRMFDGQWEVLAQHFRVVRYDMRGFGRSSEAQGPTDRRQDLRALLAHLNIDHAHFIGCSMSGTLVLDMAMETPSMVDSLTLVGATPSGFEMVGDMPRYMNEMFGEAQAGNVERVNELQTRIWFDGNFREPNEVDQVLRDKVMIMNRIPVARGTFFIADMEPVNPLTPPAVERLSEVICPTLVVVGSVDHPELLRAADVMAEGIPHAQKVVIEGTSHIPSFEQPALFNRLVLDFLREAQTQKS
jgi:pimeloyl-ACP methyl ester carboxylesterase